MNGSGSLAAIAALLAATGLVLGVMPGLDLVVADQFGSPTGFAWRGSEIANLLRQVGLWLPFLTGIACLAALIRAVLMPSGRTSLDARTLFAIVLAYALGPGLLVNGVLKEHWHRPRPAQIVQFGGDSAFTPWWSPSGTCKSNCSFVSGEVSNATLLIVASRLLPATVAGVAACASIAFITLVALLRIAFGGHFLSDVMLAILLTHLLAAALMRLFHSPIWRYGVPGLLEQDLRGAMRHVMRQTLLGLSRLATRRYPVSVTPPGLHTRGWHVFVIGWEGVGETGHGSLSPRPAS